MRVVFTKCDLAEEVVLFERVKSVCQQFRAFSFVHPEVHLVSAREDRGIAELRMSVKQAVLECPQRTIRKSRGRIEYSLGEAISEDDQRTFRLLIEQDLRQASRQNLLESRGPVGGGRE